VQTEQPVLTIFSICIRIRSGPPRSKTESMHLALIYFGLRNRGTVLDGCDSRRQPLALETEMPPINFMKLLAGRPPNWTGREVCNC